MDPTASTAAGGRPPHGPTRRILTRLTVPTLAVALLASVLLLLRPAPAHAAASVECTNAGLAATTLSGTFPQPDGVDWSVSGTMGTCKDLSIGKGAKVQGGTWKASGRATGTCESAVVTGSATFTWQLAGGGTATSTTGVESGTVAPSSVGLSLGSIDSGKFAGASMVLANFAPKISTILARCPIEPKDVMGSKGTLSIVG